MAQFDSSPILKISSSPVLSQFLHECVDDLIGKTTLGFDSYNSDIEWTIEDFNKARKEIQKFYRDCVTNDEFKLNIDSKLMEDIKNCYDIRKEDILASLIKKRLVKDGYNLVENFDWRIKWILGSSSLASIRQSLLQLDLMCIRNSKNGHHHFERDTVNCEIGLENIDNLIKQLETIEQEITNTTFQ